ncbi:MAG: EamA family transporter [Xanthomonadales bacterium]|nr:EamA family transporter [Xanthomonadales bacterium]
MIFLVALVGIIIARPLKGGEMAGNLVALADGAVYAAMVVYLRAEGRSEPGNDIFWSMAVAAIVLSPSLAISGPGAAFDFVTFEGLDTRLPVILWAVGLGVVATGFAYFGISIVLKSVSANVYSLVDIIVSPVVAATLAWLVFEEMPGTSMIAGSALLLGSGLWLTREMSRGRHNQAVHPCQQR